MLNKRSIIIWGIAGVIMIGTNASQFFIWKHINNKTKADCTVELESMQQTMSSLGGLDSYWAVKGDVRAGVEIKDTDLISVPLPNGSISNTFVKNKKDIVGKFYKINLPANMPISSDLVLSTPLDNTVREVDIISDNWSIGLKEGDFIDFNIVYPYGEYYTVLSHKRIYSINGKTLKIRLNATERYFYQASLVDYFLQKQKGASIYSERYVEPGAQNAATVTYSIPKNVLSILTADVNVLDKISYDANIAARTVLEAGMANIASDKGSLLSGGRNEQIGRIDAGKTEESNNKKDEVTDLNAGLKPPSTPEQGKDNTVKIPDKSKNGSGVE